jgi:hypothetical protein
MTTLPRFRLKVAPPLPDSAAGPSAPPQQFCLDLGVASTSRAIPDSAERAREDAATSTKKGSLNYDRASGEYPMEWSSLDHFESWCRSEELSHSIEFILSETVHGRALWAMRRVFVCSREPSGGPHHYQKKHPERRRKIGSKKTGCRGRIVIKTYPHTATVLGRYDSDHDHETGPSNLIYVHLPHVTRDRIKTMLQQKIDPREIVRVVQNSAPDGTRDRFICLRDVSRMARALEDELIRLDSEDAISSKLWVDRLKGENVNIFYKDKLDPSPPASKLQGDTFMLCIQTPFQMDAFRRLGNGFNGIDATHNITHYNGMLLFTIIVRDQWGHGA